jgi:hypothetical protein
MTHSMATPSMRRPGLVSFAGVLLCIFGGFEVIAAIYAFSGAVWLTSTTGVWGHSLWAWGIIDAVIAFVAFYAAYDIFHGGQVGRIVGLIIASISMFRWFFYLPYMTNAPLVGIVMLVLDLLVIYGLAAHGEYFDGQGSWGGQAE